MRRELLLCLLFVFGCQSTDSQAPPQNCLGQDCAPQENTRWTCPNSDDPASQENSSMLRWLGESGRACNGPSSEIRLVVDQQRVGGRVTMTGEYGTLDGVTVLATGKSKNAKYSIQAVLRP